MESYWSREQPRSVVEESCRALLILSTFIVDDSK